MSADFVAYCQELLAPLGAVRVRRMFGGHGLYAQEVFIAILSREDRLFLKVDDLTRAQFEAAGCTPFAYLAKGSERQVLGFYTPPEDAMDGPALMLPWGRLALAAALRTRAAASPKRAAPRPQAQPRERGTTAPTSRRKAPTKRVA